MAKRQLSSVQKLRVALALRQYRRPQLDVPHAVLGSEYGAHSVCTDELTSNSVVYSFGLGKDISFDLDLIERFGCTVHGFDPTPESISWVESQSLPDQFTLHQLGLADRDGTARFFPPVNPTHISHTLIEDKERADGSFEVEVRRLVTIAKELGHNRIDVLKMDIEGAEYDAIEDVVTSMIDGDIDVRQVLVEYHHQFKTIGAERTRASIRLLNSRGFKTFHVSEIGREISFVKRP